MERAADHRMEEGAYNIPLWPGKTRTCYLLTIHLHDFPSFQVTDAVHKNKSFIYLQLWALGRAADPRQLAEEAEATGQDLPYVSASPIRLSTAIFPRPTDPDPAPRALTVEEISEYIEFYAQAAENAVLKAGFDGVELHGANGYLVDQFLQDVSNERTDKYGGSVENRARFALDALDAIVKRVGPRKVGMRMSPWSVYQGDLQMTSSTIDKGERSNLFLRYGNERPCPYIHLSRRANYTTVSRACLPTRNRAHTGGVIPRRGQRE